MGTFPKVPSLVNQFSLSTVFIKTFSPLLFLASKIIRRRMDMFPSWIEKRI